MYLTNPFRHFDPKKGSVPRHFSFGFDQIAARARQILKSRDGKAIRQAWMAIQWMFENEAVQSRKWDELARLAEGNEETDDTYVARAVIDSETALLLECRDHIKISNYEKFPNGTWAEYFAVLALAFIGYAAEDEAEYGGDSRVRKKTRDDAMHKFVEHWAIDAMEAANIAELLRRENALTLTQQDRSTKDHRKQVSLQAKTAAVARHADHHALKEEFIEFRKNHADISSTAKAARRFLKGLPSTKAKLLTPTNAVRTLTNAWTDHKKGRLRS